MPLISKSKDARFAFQFGRQSALRSTEDVIEQLQAQLTAERAQHQYNLSVKEQELALVLRELAEVRLQLAKFEAFANAPSPSPSLH